MTRVLVVRLSAMGDVVEAVGAVEALAVARPDLELHWAVQRELAPLLEGLPFVRSVIAHRRRPGLRGMVATARAVRALRPDIALDLQSNWKSAALAALSLAPRRIGIAAPWRREPGSRMLLTETVAAVGPPHPAKVAMAVVRALAPVRALPPRLLATADEITREANAVAALGIDPNRPFTAAVLSDAADPRGWRGVPPANAAPLLWVAGPAEQAVTPLGPGAVLRHGPGELRRLIALGALLARLDGDVVGPDRGATHVLAAAGVRTRVLFGPQDPARTAPVGVTVLTSPSPPSCAPCRRRSCRHPDGPVCMEFSLSEARRVGTVSASGDLES